MRRTRVQRRTTECTWGVHGWERSQRPQRPSRTHTRAPLWRHCPSGRELVRGFAHTGRHGGGGNLEVLVAEVLLVATSGGTTLAARLVHLLHDGVHDLLCRYTARTQAPQATDKPQTSNEHSGGVWQPQTGAAKGCTQRDLGAGPQTQSVCFQS